MSSLEVADIFCSHGSAYRAAHKGQLSLRQLKAMSAIERCRTAALGGHVLRCADCSHTEIAYNSCRNRHCPKCQASAARRWLQARELELLPVEYYHVVFTLPSLISDLAFQNPAVVYNILFKAASKTLLTIAADPKHLGARIGLTAVLHTWGSAMTHHPHVHCIVPGGGLSIDGQQWIRCKKGFFLDGIDEIELGRIDSLTARQVNCRDLQLNATNPLFFVSGDSYVMTCPLLMIATISLTVELRR